MRIKLFVLLLILSQAITTFGQEIKQTYTKLSVTNNKKHPVEVYVTFAAQNPQNKCCAVPAGLSDFTFLQPIHRLMGKFTLAPGATKIFDPKGKCFSGNICFYIEPQCQVDGADFNHGKDGTSIAEFTLNPNKGCAEAIDISCVNGVNSFIKLITDAKGGWAYGPNNTPISTIYNKGLQQNAGLPGVYPVNCTTCTAFNNAPCSKLPMGPAQTEAICNVQRSTKGGTVKVVLLNQ